MQHTWQWSTLGCPTPTDCNASLQNECKAIESGSKCIDRYVQPYLSRWIGIIGGQTHGHNILRKRNGLPKFQQRYVMIIRVRVKVTVLDNSANGSLLGLGIRYHRLIVITQNDADL